MAHRSRTLLTFTALAALAACEKAAPVAQPQQLGPEDVQVMSQDREFALELIGDSVHVYMPGSRVSVPSTSIENLRYADGRLRFDIKGLGVRIFDVGDGSEQGAAISQVEALMFIANVTRNQAKLQNTTAK
ncbi:MAG: hypothetical protein P3B76_13240 [Gemmatimonadota bacterium]|nr:hypothetical protein [Gemmatimonadota bacterium]MDQ8173637.1 hypothetical protein [Gemmatimonadota bacterium]